MVNGGVACQHALYDVVCKPMHATVDDWRVVVIVEPQSVVVYQPHVVVYLDAVNTRHHSQHVVDTHHLDGLRPDDELGALGEVVDPALSLRLRQSHQVTVDGRPRHLQQPEPPWGFVPYLDLGNY